MRFKMVVDLSNVSDVDMFESQQASKSAVKIIKNSKGVNWEIKVVSGEESLMEGLKKEAIKIHNDLVNRLESELAEQNPLLRDN